jgi:hypothetical protein
VSDELHAFGLEPMPQFSGSKDTNPVSSTTERDGERDERVEVAPS